MKKTFTKSHVGTFLLAALLPLLPTPSVADSAWKWQMSLRVQTAGDAMYMPAAVAFDPSAERYYAVDTGRSRLVSFDRNGTLLRAFTADDRLKSPFDMVRLDSGQLWVVEKGRNSITRIDVAAKVVEPHTLKDGDRQVFPDRIANAGGSLYVLDRVGGFVLRLGADLQVEQRFGCPDCLGGLSDFAIANGVVWGLETQGKKVLRFRPDGGVDQTIPLGDRVDFPVSLAFDPTGFLYVLDRHKAGIAVYSPDGQFKYRFLSGGQGGGQLFFPREVRFDPWGRLCVVDEGNGRVEIFSR